MKIVELKTFADMQGLYPLIEQLNPGMSKKVFSQRLKEMRKLGYRCIAAVEGKKIIGAMGFWVGMRFWCGPFIEPDNVIVDKGSRKKGTGKKLMDWLDAEAKRLGCERVVLASYTHSHASHAFYMRQGYVIRGFVFTRDLKG